MKAKGTKKLSDEDLRAIDLLCRKSLKKFLQGLSPEKLRELFTNSKYSKDKPLPKHLRLENLVAHQYREQRLHIAATKNRHLKAAAPTSVASKNTSEPFGNVSLRYSKEAMGLSLPPAKRAKRYSAQKQISDLADADLSAIFERLPPCDRLVVSAVCRRWYELSRGAWLDVTELDLSPIPGKRIGTIVRRCPNLQSVVALKKSFDLNELYSLSEGSKLSVVKFYDCSFAIKGVRIADADYNASSYDILAQIFSKNLQRASFHGLILHNARCFDKSVVNSRHFRIWDLSASFLPTSLTRLQLSHLKYKKGIVDNTDGLLEGLGQLESLECLILHESESCRANRPDYFYNANLLGHVDRICTLKNLRELSIDPTGQTISMMHNLGSIVACLSKLEVLFLSDIYAGHDAEEDLAEDLAEVITTNSVLRILVLSGEFQRGRPIVEPIELPARKRFPHGFGSNPLPLLHIFVGKEASEEIRFATSSSDAAIIHPINEPMPQFLEREDIAAIFEGVWVAEKIKETAKFGGELWSHEQHDRAAQVQRI